MNPKLEIPVRIGRQNYFLGMILLHCLGDSSDKVQFWFYFFLVGWLLGLIVTLGYELQKEPK